MIYCQVYHVVTLFAALEKLEHQNHENRTQRSLPLRQRQKI
jgi:hypothetical protein